MTGKRGKNDAADAAAICEAVQRPNMRFVPIKSEEQQSRLMVHRARQGDVQTRTALINRVRGLMSEFGIVLPQKAEVVHREAALHLEELPGWATPSSATCSASCTTWTNASRSTTCTFARSPRSARRRSN